MGEVQDNEPEVESILAEKVISYPKTSAKGSVFRAYKVRRKGREYDTWEPEGHLTGCEELLRQWHANNPIRDPTPRGNGKRKSDEMESENGYSGSSGSEHPKLLRTHIGKPQPGTAAYIRYRKGLAPAGNLMHPDRQRFIEKLWDIPGPPIILFNDVDGDPSPPVAFEFIPRYKILSPDVIDFVKENSEFWAGCSCDGGVCKSGCSCMEDDLVDGPYYDKHGRLKMRENNSVINECNERCSCGMDCPNRVVQRGRRIPLEIFKTENKGWGLRCPLRIPKGTFIDTYPGELISLAEAEKRAEIYQSSDGGASYLFDLDKFSKVRKGEDDELRMGSQSQVPHMEIVDPNDIYVVDGRNHGGVSRFINHSCDPNLLIYAVTRERADYRLYDLAMFAHVDIPAYEELTFSYVGGDQGQPDPDVRKYKCHCGSVNCKGYLW